MRSLRSSGSCLPRATRGGHTKPAQPPHGLFSGLAPLHVCPSLHFIAVLATGVGFAIGAACGKAKSVRR